MNTNLGVTRVLGGVILAFALLATACGGGGLSADDQEFVDALIAGDTFPESVDQVCVAEEFVTALGGADGLRNNYGLEPVDFDGDIEADMTEADARNVTDAIWQCDGLADSFFIDIAGTDEPETVSCLRAAISEDNVKTLLVSGFMGDAGEALESSVENTFEEELFSAFATCELG